jgi:N-acetylmuramoyl-L-alanine amidase
MVQSASTGAGSVQPVGNGEHEVQDGECIIFLADQAGHFWETLWNDPENADVKRERGSPHVLLAGDRVHIPEIESKDEPGATEAKHRFRRKGIPINFEMCVKENGKPLKGLRYVLTIEGRITEGTVPDDGVIKAPMMPQDRTGELRVGEPPRQRKFPLSFGSLDPAFTRSGAAARLKNLGYIADDADDDLFQRALSRFQKDQGIAESATVDNATASALVDANGS